MSALDVLQCVFWISAAVVGYAYAGYPVLLLLLARLRGVAVRKAQIAPSVSVVLVVHNEEERLAGKLENLLALDYPRDRLEVVVVSDGSSDATEAIAARFGPRGVRLLRQAGPSGKPSAINLAAPTLRADVVVLCDARQDFARDALHQLVANFADPNVGVVSGELHIRVADGSAAGEGVGAYWKYEKLLRKAESRLDSTVGVTGAIYAIRRELLPSLEPATILDDVAVPMLAARSGCRVVFEPCAAAYDVAAEGGREYRRKVRTLAGNYQLVALYPFLLDPRRNRLFWQFVSHKLMRLLVPWCLLAMLLASVLLWRSPFYGSSLAAQVVFYAAALLGYLLERRAVRVRLLAIPYAFAMLNLAAASSLVGFLCGRQRAAWKGQTAA